MKKIIILIPFLFILIGVVNAQQHIVKFKVGNKEEIAKLPNYLSIDDYKDSVVTAYLWGVNFEKFKQLGIDFQLVDENRDAKSLTMATTVAQMSSWDRYPTHSVYLQMMYNFATNYPNICKIDTLGYSEAGRIILVAKITDNPDANEQEPEFYYTGQMHGDEIVDYILFLHLIDYLLSNYGTDTRVTNLINNYEIWINPLSNPDGTYASGDNTVSGATRYNSNGVDLNRNFPSPTLPNPSGQNENEIQMQIAFAEAHHFVMSANSHSGAELVNYPWDSWESSVKKHADHNWWYHVSRNYADTVHLNAPSTYMDDLDNGVTHGGDWYVVKGSRQDHMGWYQHCREVTLELSNDKMLDCELLPNHWTYNKDAMLGYIEECMYGFNGTIKNIKGEPLAAKIEIASHDYDNSEVYTDPANGDYYRPIEPGTYNVTYSSEGYISQTHSITVSDWETTTIKNVVLDSLPLASISGYVVDADDGSKLSNVQIFFQGSSISSVYTDANGFYSINYYAGSQQFLLSKSGYNNLSQTKSLDSGNNQVDFVMFKSKLISFEDGVPAGFTYIEDADWSRVSGTANTGSYSLKSGTIRNSEKTSLVYAKTTSAGNFSFYKKVSSETDFDKLTFYIDNVQKGQWSGEIDWSKETYTVTAGSHIFKWTYAKDVSTIGGSDCAWIDDVDTPSAALPQYNITFIVKDSGVIVQNANIHVLGYGHATTDINGQAVYTNLYKSTGNIPFTVDFDTLPQYQSSVIIDGNKTVIVDFKLENLNEQTAKCTIYPNPSVAGIIRVISPLNGQIKVISLSGIVQKVEHVRQGEQIIDLSNLSSGIYLLDYITTTGRDIHKIVIQK